VSPVSSSSPLFLDFSDVFSIPITTGELRHIHKLRYWPLEQVLKDKYYLPKATCDMISSFLTPMLRLQPERRAKASELVHHVWLDGVVVQGEIEMILDAERREGRARDGSADSQGSRKAKGKGKTGGSKERDVNGVALGQVMVEDAMKPVGEAEEDDDDDIDEPPPPPAPLENRRLSSGQGAKSSSTKRLSQQHPPHSTRPEAS
jgi:serine/threonine-protein kinase SRPK3